jgi:hypothetical protein
VPLLPVDRADEVIEFRVWHLADIGVLVNVRCAPEGKKGQKRRTFRA